ncbi:hypothetical protein BurJ1DRAFT_5018 [Burkholderiales bacterium JOSHI_001]|nr:hypothetical protein BurJ1DRAFT_5018 [Burkholderiales bacterium JOSHI_001]
MAKFSDLLLQLLAARQEARLGGATAAAANQAAVITVLAAQSAGSAASKDGPDSPRQLRAENKLLRKALAQALGHLKDA